MKSTRILREIHWNSLGFGENFEIIEDLAEKNVELQKSIEMQLLEDLVEIR